MTPKQIMVQVGLGKYEDSAMTWLTFFPTLDRPMTATQIAELFAEDVRQVCEQRNQGLGKYEKAETPAEWLRSLWGLRSHEVDERWDDLENRGWRHSPGRGMPILGFLSLAHMAKWLEEDRGGEWMFTKGLHGDGTVSLELFDWVNLEEDLPSQHGGVVVKEGPLPDGEGQ